MVLKEGKTYMINFMQVFIEINNAIAAVFLIYLIGNLLFMMRNVDRNLLKARLFLNESVLFRTWIYISISGASFALHSFLDIIGIFIHKGEIINTFHILEISEFIFIVSFILAIYNWYIFIGNFSKGKKKVTK